MYVIINSVSSVEYPQDICENASANNYKHILNIATPEKCLWQSLGQVGIKHTNYTTFFMHNYHLRVIT